MHQSLLKFPDADNWESWRNEHFPVFNHQVFLTHASVSALPHAVASAIADYVGQISQHGQADELHDPIYRRCKERLARLVGTPAKPSQIAFASSTSHAIGLVATGLPWQPGDNCVVADGDFPANVIPWKNLQHTHGVEVRLIPASPGTAITPQLLEPLVDEKTRIVSLASANFLSGLPLDINAIGRWLQQRKVLFCVDGIQTLGAVPFDATYVDFVCADAHKWLLGPNGIAFLWIRQSVLETMRPAILGWLAVQQRDQWLAYDTTPIDSAERFEPGSRNYLGIVGMEAALELLENYGIEQVRSRVVDLRQYAAQQLQDKGCKLLWNPAPEFSAGIVSFTPPEGDTAALYERLKDAFAVSMRADKSGQDWIRLSPHFMNCQADIDGLIARI